MSAPKKNSQNNLVAGEKRVTSSSGEVYIPASKREDGSWRKPIRVKPGYSPEEEVPAWKPQRQLDIENETPRVKQINNIHYGSRVIPAPIASTDDLDPKDAKKREKRRKENQKRREKKREAARQEAIALNSSCGEVVEEKKCMGTQVTTSDALLDELLQESSHTTPLSSSSSLSPCDGDGEEEEEEVEEEVEVEEKVEEKVECEEDVGIDFSKMDMITLTYHERMYAKSLREVDELIKKQVSTPLKPYQLERIKGKGHLEAIMRAIQKHKLRLNGH